MNYLLKRHGFKFFELVLVAASLIIAITVIRNSTNFFPKAYSKSTLTHTFKSGWNLVSIPFREYSAEGLCANYNFEEVARWNGETWERYSCIDLGPANFTITPYKAFFVKQLSDSYPVTFMGKQERFSFKMTPGWNSFYVAAKFQNYKLASDLCSKSPQQGFEITQVARWVFNEWNIHTCGVPFNDFPIMKGENYFLKTSVPGSTDSTEGTNPSMMLVTPE
ncbi:MAG: hypothetical protein UT10_C0006G0020 [Candidatus Woesebacteria bacterium GW2011_GWB1_38_8b]|uniref:Uncharacterized protein n=1 Tax=Candidatus Woesebacteria bacterium GW2011_GWB1_38_8b TaxID=1618571 RepID=A0A0G0PDU7_9BACT|nr:MAG: hypothetical protein UT10_C0006G0020 [Candidatus Woesebacteria bacterium GW2011_GWB1_38_8b]